jgi:hypothetical protein
MIPNEIGVIPRKRGKVGHGEALGATSTEKFPEMIQSEGEKMKKLVLSIAAGLLLAPGFAAAKDTTFSGEIMDSQCAKGGGHESMFKKEGTDDPKACTLACVKAGGKFVLFDAATNTYHMLDNQTKPRPFAGQKVDINGTLNKASNTIHVTDIKAAS